MIRAVVGAGGKTSLIRKMAEESQKQGRKVLICTTTHMYKEAGCIVGDFAEPIIEALQTGFAMAGTDKGEKISALSEAVYREVCAYADDVFVEADGSKHKAIKFPAEHEPVIPENADEIIVVCGLHALGQPLIEAAHRPELVKRCLAADDDTIITAEHVQILLREGYLKLLRCRYPDKTISVHASHDGSLYQRALAALLKAEMDVSLIKEEWFQAQPRLFICGGGHVSQALAQMAHCLDFSTAVMDDREEFIRRDNFPTTEQLICDRFDKLSQYLSEGDYCIVVTRGHKDDLCCVEQILPKKTKYLGMIGSKKKVATAFDLLRQDGFSEDEIATIHAPIGLDIGAVTPAEIALSILAEIVQIKNQKCCSSASRKLSAQKGPGVLCIITGKQGSSPRGVGSMMFVTEQEIVDSIGGGAVEAAAIEAARKEPAAALRSYDLNKKNKNALDMVCGGSNQVLFLPLE